MQRRYLFKIPLLLHGQKIIVDAVGKTDDIEKTTPLQLQNMEWI